MTNPIGIHERLEAEMRNPHVPEGVSLRVKEADMDPDALLGAFQKAYPEREFTGTILHAGWDEFGPGDHEMVLEVKA